MASDKSQIVETEYGQIKGTKASTVLGRNYFSFRTIPYMKAPTGKLRFRDAQPPEKWSETLDGNIERPSYFSVNSLTYEIVGQEDAGILSISTPYLDRNLPVVVYIHGGGFQFGYGAPDQFGCDYILQKDVVLVTINYRVGLSGFISLADPSLGVPGNAGLKDQVFALKWVQRNISKFGGDPNNVTVSGTSAGAASVHFFMMSDQAKGLFHKAIMMSGTSFIKTWAAAPKSDFAERVANTLGWPGNDDEKGILEYLEGLDGKSLFLSQLQILTDYEKYGDHILFPFTPIVEPYLTDKTFLPKDPVLLGRNAWSNDTVDCIFGGGSLEGGIMQMLGPINLKPFQSSAVAFAPKRELELDIWTPQGWEKAKKYGERLKKLYYGNEDPTSDNIDKYLTYAGDLHFWHGIYRAVLSRRNSKAKTYLYHFALHTSLNIGEVIFKLKYEGGTHGDDLFYLFHPNKAILKEPGLASDEFKFIQDMTSMFVSFMKAGNPNEEFNKS